MGFFDEQTWSGRIYSGGWRAGGGGSADIVAPATGQAIGSYGVANVADLDAAVERGVAAQRE